MNTRRVCAVWCFSPSTENMRSSPYRRLESQNISYIVQPVGSDRLNLYFGREECLNAIRMIVTRPLNLLTPEEDFMLGTMLGYDICAQCERYCERKNRCNKQCNGHCDNQCKNAS